jgi:hypothetical protein
MQCVERAEAKLFDSLSPSRFGAVWNEDLIRERQQLPSVTTTGPGQDCG